MKRAGLVAAVIAAAFAVWIWTDRSGRAGRAEPRPAVELPAAPEVAPEPPLPRDEEETAAEPSVAVGPVAVRGSVVFTESGRVPQTFTARLWPLDREGELVEVAGTEGRFDAELPAGRYAVLDVEADGEEIDLPPDVVVDQRGEVEIRLAEAHEVAVVVVDARDRKPVADALVYEDRDHDWDEPGAHLPGPHTLELEPRRTDSKGHLSLGRGRGSVRLCFFAEGYAWHAAEIPFGAGAEVVVELERGGDLRLLIPRFAELEAPQVWVRRSFATDWRRLAVPAGTGEVLVRGLAADEYAILVCRGEWFEGGKVYGTGSGTIPRGGTATITIAVTPEPAQVMVKVTGTVTAASGWKERPRWITLKGAEKSNAEVRETIQFHGGFAAEPPAADGEPGDPTEDAGASEEEDERPPVLCRGTPETGGDPTFRFETHPIPAGRYFVEIEPCLWAKQVTVSDRSAHFDFDLPQPVTIRVRTVDTQQRTIGPAARVSLQEPVAGRTSWSPHEAVREGDALVFQAPPGNVTVRAEAPGFLDAEETFEIREDRDVTLTLGRAGILVVQLRIDGRPFDGAGARVVLDVLDRITSSGFEGGAARFDRLRPGTWRVTLRDVAGCEPVKTIEVEVAAGETRDVWIDLKRTDR